MCSITWYCVSCRFKRDLMWNIPGSRVVENALIAAMQTCYPEHLLGGYERMPCVFPNVGDSRP